MKLYDLLELFDKNLDIYIYRKNWTQRFCSKDRAKLMNSKILRNLNVKSMSVMWLDKAIRVDVADK